MIVVVEQVAIAGKLDAYTHSYDDHFHTDTVCIERRLGRLLRVLFWRIVSSGFVYSRGKHAD